MLRHSYLLDLNILATSQGLGEFRLGMQLRLDRSFKWVWFYKSLHYTTHLSLVLAFVLILQVHADGDEDIQLDKILTEPAFSKWVML